MSDKAAKKKQYILDTARKVFSEKGFKNVTMKDIVEACEISRGGLYIYFESTEQIFEELLAEEGAKDESAPKKANSGGNAFALFLNEQKKEILKDEPDLSVALYEYLFLKHSEKSEAAFYKDKFNATVMLVAKLIEAGCESGEFFCEDSEGAARNIVYVIEGLKLASKTRGISEKDVDNELLYLVSGLIAEE